MVFRVPALTLLLDPQAFAILSHIETVNALFRLDLLQTTRTSSELSETKKLDSNKTVGLSNNKLRHFGRSKRPP